MTEDLYETQFAVDRPITAHNEHLIPFGSIDEMGTKKYSTGWFAYRSTVTSPVLGHRLRSIGDGPVETLGQFRMRARATVVSRMQHEGVAGWSQVQSVLRTMGLLDVEEWQPGMPVSHLLDLSDSRLQQALVWNHRSDKVLRVGRRDGAQPLVMRLEPENDAPVWTGEPGTWPEWVTVKRLLWENGSRLASAHGWCGTYGNLMSSLGIDSTFEDARGVDLSTRINLPVGA